MTAAKRLVLIVCMVAMAIAVDAGSRFFVTQARLATYTKTYGEQAVRRLNSLIALMDGLVAAPEDKKIIEVNRFFNQVEYQTDIENWGKKDYWASRLEFLGKGRGDCEDFAVAKFLTMIQLGVSEKKLFLTYVKAIGYPEAAHLVVSYYKEPDSVPFVLDNYNKTILPATQRHDLIPVYSFTANDLYIQKQQGLGRRVDRSSLKTQKNLKGIDLEIQVREQ
jgi:predicted transglutaminase-like cysteine proteinase